METHPLNIVMVEDDAHDAALVSHALSRAALRFISRRVDTEEGFRRELVKDQPDVILSDFSMPTFNGLRALTLARELCPDVPFIFVSGTIGEESAINALKAGATDYILKQNLGRLGTAVIRARSDYHIQMEQRRIQNALQKSELRFRLADSTGDVWDWTASTDDAHISAQWKHRLGYENSEITNTAEAWFSLVEAGDRRRILKAFAQHARRHLPFDVEFRALAKDGSHHWSHLKGQAVWDDHGRAKYMAGSMVDITERKHAELKVKRLNRVYAVLSSINSLIVRTPEKKELFREACQISVEAGNFPLAWIGLLDSNKTKIVPMAWAGAGVDYLEHIPLGLDPEDHGQYGLVGKCISFGLPVLVQDVANETEGDFKKQATDRGLYSFALLPLTVGQEVIGLLALYAGEKNFFDEAESRLLKELAGDISFALDHLNKSERLNYLAYFDTLTGLPNRTLIHDRLTQALQTLTLSKDESNRLAVLCININRFKNINDTLGRYSGDLLIQETAERLSAAMSTQDTLARIGADQFAAVLHYKGEPSEAIHLLNEQAFPSLEREFQIEGASFYVTSRVGIALFPDDGQDADTLFANAEAASRAAGVAKSRYQFYTASMNARVRSQLSIESKLHRALENNEFVLHYQPKVALDDGRFNGMEALIRWRDPEAGLISPAVFIPVLEETGLIIEVGQWVIEQAIRDHEEWHALGGSPPRIAVNVSAVQMRHSDFLKKVEIALRARKRSYPFLDIEITESLFMEKIEANVQRLQTLREMDIRLAVDDFGTGYSSLSYLKRFPIDYLKIDQSFVRDVTSSPDAAAICGAIIDLAHNLKLKVIAEGVETQAQMNYLRRRYCDEMQGYYFSKALPKEQLLELLVKGVGLDFQSHASQGVKNILIVDDEAGILASMRRLLRNEGYAILTAASAHEGFEMLANHNIQVILSDQRMPEMSGTDFLARARDLYPDTIRIVLSGYTDLETISDAINRGAIYKFLTKPWDDDLLRENIREAFRHHEAGRRNRRD